MIESANETAKVGQVTGSLADALNWVGISEDAFNEKLAACSSESERNRLIMETLSGAYHFPFRVAVGTIGDGTPEGGRPEQLLQPVFC